MVSRLPGQVLHPVQSPHHLAVVDQSPHHLDMVPPPPPLRCNNNPRWGCGQSQSSQDLHPDWMTGWGVPGSRWEGSEVEIRFEGEWGG